MQYVGTRRCANRAVTSDQRCLMGTASEGAFIPSSSGVRGGNVPAGQGFQRRRYPVLPWGSSSRSRESTEVPGRKGRLHEGAWFFSQKAFILLNCTLSPYFSPACASRENKMLRKQWAEYGVDPLRTSHRCLVPDRTGEPSIQWLNVSITRVIPWAPARSSAKVPP